MVQERVQRRLAAILAADIAGYARLMEAEEAGTHARLKALRAEIIDPAIAEFGGRVFKTTGDGILIEFPSAVDAVNHAVKVQRAMAARDDGTPEAHRIRFRVGISLGDVIVDGDDLYGNGVNVASRLEGIAEPGGICISGNVRDSVGNEAGVAFEDLGERQVKNIERPVRVHAIRLAAETEMAKPEAPVSEKASIAVLPFANMSGDPEQEYFSDGISEDIITALSRARWFRVVSRNSAFAYKGTSLNVRQVADELGVRYLLEGSVRKAGSRVRITAQLIDGATDNHLWAERYDRELSDIFEVQDEITASIASQIEPQLRRAEIKRANVARPDSMDVWDMYQQGMWHMFRKDDPDFHKAFELFRRVTRLDPNFAPACAALAQACYYLVHFFQVDDPAHYVEEGLTAARRGAELDGEDAAQMWALGRLLYARGDLDEAMAALETSIRLNPLSAEARLTVGRILLDRGRFADAVAAMHESLRVCPNDHMIGIVMSRLAEGYFHLREYDEAIEWSRKATRQTVAPRMWGRVTLLSALGHAGDRDAARQALADMLARRPDFSLSFVRANYPMDIPEAVENMVDGLSKAGVPADAPSAGTG